MSYNRYPMPTPSPTPDSSCSGSSSSFHYDEYPSQISGSQVINYNSYELHQNQSLSTSNFHNAQVVVPQSQFAGNNVSLIVGDKRVTISQAGVTAFCNDFICTELANNSRLTTRILDDLAQQGQINIHYSKSTTGSILKRKLATELPKAAAAAGLVVAMGAYSPLIDTVDAFFKYEYSGDVTEDNNYQVKYAVNDGYTITGCFLSRNLKAKYGSRKFALVSGSSTSIEYDIQCCLFTFKVAQAKPYIYKHLG